MRASIATQICRQPVSCRASSATASKLSMGNTGSPAPKASPWATEHAVRSPVNAPGPRPKAIASRSLNPTPARASKAMIDGTRAADASAPPAPSCSHTTPRTCSAMLICSVAVSKARRWVMQGV